MITRPKDTNRKIIPKPKNKDLHFEERLIEDISRKTIEPNGSDLEKIFTDRRLYKIVKSLPTEHKQVLYLLYVKEHSGQTVAEMLRVPWQTVNSRERIALRTIFNQYTDTIRK